MPEVNPANCRELLIGLKDVCIRRVQSHLKSSIFDGSDLFIIIQGSRSPFLC